MGGSHPPPPECGYYPYGEPPRVYIGRFQYRDKILRFKFDIGDLVLFQTPHMDIREWEKGKTVPYQMGMITFREKAGYKTIDQRTFKMHTITSFFLQEKPTTLNAKTD